MNELAQIPAGGTQLDPMTVAKVFKESGMFPDIQSVAAACTKIIIGRGLGLSDFDAMTGLHIIKGKAVLASNLMAASVKRAGKYDYRATLTDTACEITFFERNDAKAWEEIGTSRFTMEDARRAQLNGDNWRKYPRNMLFARCISNGYKAFCPDALGAAPVYVEAHGEMEITEDGLPTVASAPPAALPAPATEKPQDAPVKRKAPKPALAQPEAVEVIPAPAKSMEVRPEAVKAADQYPDEWKGEVKILRVVCRDGKPCAVQVENEEHGKAWVAFTVGEYVEMARANVNQLVRLELHRVGETLTCMKWIGPLRAVMVDEKDLPF